MPWAPLTHYNESSLLERNLIIFCTKESVFGKPGVRAVRKAHRFVQISTTQSKTDAVASASIFTAPTSRNSLQEHQAWTEENGSKLKSSRSTRAAGRKKATTFVAAPAKNDSKLKNEWKNETPRDRSNRNKATTLAAIHNADLNNRGVQRAVLKVLVGKRNHVHLSHGGTSKSSMNKTNATHGHKAIGLSKFLAQVPCPSSLLWKITRVKERFYRTCQRTPPNNFRSHPWKI